MYCYAIAACLCLSLLPAVYAQATPEQPEPKQQAAVPEQKPPAAAPEKTPSAKPDDSLPSLQDLLPDVGFWEGVKDFIADVLGTAKMALIGIIAVLALAVLGKIFVFMHK